MPWHVKDVLVPVLTVLFRFKVRKHILYLFIAYLVLYFIYVRFMFVNGAIGVLEREEKGRKVFLFPSRSHMKCFGETADSKGNWTLRTTATSRSNYKISNVGYLF